MFLILLKANVSLSFFFNFVFKLGNFSLNENEGETVELFDEFR